MARELAPAGLRSSPLYGAAARPSGSKLPRHCFFLRGLRASGRKTAQLHERCLDFLLDQPGGDCRSRQPEVQS
ncbi:hypothetical protein C1X64_23215 [Pseudomonas sp. GW456-E7]|nr:hypothetical protein C1X64_23215 [Pseudomonas sp. GW456-E7]